MAPPITPSSGAPLAPDFALIGAQKAGTTSLHGYLAQLPGVFVTHHKEPHFFSGPGDGRWPAWSEPGRDDLYREFVLDPDRYEALFEGSDNQLRGEGSTLYLPDPEAAIRLTQRNPDLKAIAVLREPAARAHSSWKMWRRAGLEPLSFADAVEDEPRRKAAGAGFAKAYVETGRYATHVERWSALLRPGNLHLVETSRLDHEPVTVLHEIAAFLGVDTPDTDEIDLTRKNLGEAAPRSYLAHSMVRRSRVATLARSALPRPIRARIGGAIRSVNTTSADPIDNEVAQAIRSSLLDETVRLETITGWDLTSWKPARH